VMAGANPVATTLTISTTPSTLSGLRTPGGIGGMLAFALPSFGLTLCGSPLRRSRQRRIAAILLGLVLLISMAALLGCGGAGETVTNLGHPGTPPGNYSVTVTATAGSVSHTQVVSLVVH
jgi:hypothetical protein